MNQVWRHRALSTAEFIDRYGTDEKRAAVLAQSRRRESCRASNSILGNLKTAISGMYHAFNFCKHANRNLAEELYRFNRRIYSAPSILARLVRVPALTALVTIET